MFSELLYYERDDHGMALRTDPAVKIAALLVG